MITLKQESIRTETVKILQSLGYMENLNYKFLNGSIPVNNLMLKNKDDELFLYFIKKGQKEPEGVFWTILKSARTRFDHNTVFGYKNLGEGKVLLNYKGEDLLENSKPINPETTVKNTSLRTLKKILNDLCIKPISQIKDFEKGFFYTASPDRLEYKPYALKGKENIDEDVTKKFEELLVACKEVDSNVLGPRRGSGLTINIPHASILLFKEKEMEEYIKKNGSNIRNNDQNIDAQIPLVSELNETQISEELLFPRSLLFKVKEETVESEATKKSDYGIQQEFLYLLFGKSEIREIVPRLQAIYEMIDQFQSRKTLYKLMLEELSNEVIFIHKSHPLYESLIGRGTSLDDLRQKLIMREA